MVLLPFHCYPRHPKKSPCSFRSGCVILLVCSSGMVVGANPHVRSLPSYSLRKCTRMLRMQPAHSVKSFGDSVVFDPTEPDDCMFSCFANALSERGIHIPCHQLRAHVASMWERTPQALHRPLAQWAESEGLRPQEYLVSLRHRLWGGLPEMHKMAHAWHVRVTLYHYKQKVVYSLGPRGGFPLALGYTGSHYVRLNPKSARALPGFRRGPELKGAACEVWDLRGGSPANKRHAIFQKLKQVEDCTLQDVKQLLKVLETHTSIDTIAGTPAEVHAKLLQLVRANKLHYAGGQWSTHVSDAPQDNPAKPEEDPLYKSDPWAKTTPWLKWHLESQIVMEDGQQLRHVELAALTGAEAKGVAFVTKEQAAVAYAAHTGTTEVVVLLADGEPAGQHAKRTQLMVRDLQGHSKTVTAWVMVAGAKAITVTHPAREVALATGVAAELTLMAHAREMDTANFSAFQQRSNLHQFIGKHSGFVYIKAAFTRDTQHGKMHTYLVEIARDQVRSLLQVSGVNGVTVGANEALDAELGLTTVYTDAYSLSSLLQRLDEVKHVGVVGPLRRGGYLIRCDTAGVAEVRKAVNPNDPRFSQFPSLVV
eukprot:5250557-Amphidinium_carterae.1